MDMSQAPWCTVLLHYTETCRSVRPLPSRDALSTEEEARCQILGGSLISWLQEEFPQIMRQQQALRLRQHDDPLPLIVIATEIAGLVAADEIIGASNEIVFLLPEEYDRWDGRRQDASCSWHIDYWSAFHAVTDEDWSHLVMDGINGIGQACARWHIVGSLWGALWEWTGDELMLVAPGYREVVY